jgi:hypothetical protein
MWHLESERAAYRGPRLQCSIDLEAPQSGVGNVRLRRPEQWTSLGERLHLFSLALPAESLTDAYVRANDLVATFEPRDAQQRRMRVYWRVLEDPPPMAFAGLELIFSVQTSRLDSDPHVEVASTLAGELTERSEHLLRFDLMLAPPITCLLLTHPANHSTTTVATTRERHDVRQAIFAGRLEKGVIRCARLRAVFLASDAPSDAARRLLRQFVDSPPPLTT